MLPSSARLRVAVSLGLLAALTAGCHREDDSVRTLGHPTRLAGRTPVEAICAIQGELRALPKPVLADVVHHDRSARRQVVELRFAKENLPAYEQYVLTDSARAWVGTHTEAELGVALMPLVLDPDLGEAAVVLTALATNRRYRAREYGRHPAEIGAGVSTLLAETGYRSPAEPGRWSREDAHRFALPAEIRLAYSSPEDPGSLNELLRHLQFDLTYYENGLMLTYPEGTFAKVATLDEWSAANPLPAIPDAARHADLLATYGRDFALLGAYPGGLPYGLAVYELGLHRYWPLVYSQTYTVKELTGPRGQHEKARQEFLHEVRERIHDLSREVCAPDPA